MVVGGGLGTIVLVLAVALLGGDPRQILDQLSQSVPTQGEPGTTTPPTAEEQEAKEFVAVVLKDTEDVWGELFASMGKTYQAPRLILFTGQVESACGSASSAVGPFYCPGDAQVYLDTEFFDDLHRRFGAPGDFAEAYVIAHEVGHHVQNLLGVSGRVQSLRRQMGEAEANRLSVRLELQADFFAGVWAHHAQAAKQILEAGDIEEALSAATAIGDDRLQRQARGTVTPDAFTHGTSEQRMRWFRRGFETGDLSQGDTFNADPL
jgi:predicted metalloprotease